MKLDAFRKIIREEMRSVIKEELSLITQIPITETKIIKKPVVDQKSIKPLFSEIVNEEVVLKQRNLFKPTGNPMLDILNETAAAGEWRTLNGGTYNSSQAVGFAGGMPGENVKVVDSVNQMLANKQPVSNINQVVIDTVPNFSGIMSKLKEIGKL